MCARLLGHGYEGGLAMALVGREVTGLAELLQNGVGDKTPEKMDSPIK